jgi:hypothetical protein
VGAEDRRTEDWGELADSGAERLGTAPGVEAEPPGLWEGGAWAVRGIVAPRKAKPAEPPSEARSSASSTKEAAPRQGPAARAADLQSPLEAWDGQGRASSTPGAREAAGSAGHSPRVAVRSAPQGNAGAQATSVGEAPRRTHPGAARAHSRSSPVPAATPARRPPVQVSGHCRERPDLVLGSVRSPRRYARRLGLLRPRSALPPGPAPQREALRVAVKMPRRIASGVGGQPGTVTSTGMTLETPPRLA